MSMNTIGFSGGLFWHLIEPLKNLPGVTRVKPGYMGGNDLSPTFETVKSGKSDHRFAVVVEFDESIATPKFLLERYWRLIDPTDPTGQFKDRGKAYETVVYVSDDTMKQEVLLAKNELQESRRFVLPIAVKIERLSGFVPASPKEASYATDYPSRVDLHNRTSGRAEGLALLWKQDLDPAKLKQTLTPMQYHVTQKQGTEPPFQNAYWNEFEDGIYVDIVSGEPLFSSRDKFDSHCGWPSFAKPIAPIRAKHDGTYGMIRTEVRTIESDIHLGHVFDDGPLELGGLRYCINSASLRFIPKDLLVQEGYAPYLAWFQKEE